MVKKKKKKSFVCRVVIDLNLFIDLFIFVTALYAPRAVNFPNIFFLGNADLLVYG